VGLGAAFVITTALNELFVFGPLRRRLRTLRVNLGIAVTDRSAGAVTELEELLDSVEMLFHLGRGSDEALRDDLLRLRAHNQQLVQVATLGDRLNAALPYRETVDQMLVQVRSFLRADFVALLGNGEGGRFRLEGMLGGGARAIDSSCCDERSDCPLVLACERDSLLRTSDHRCRFFPHTMTSQITLPLTIAEGETRFLLATSTTGESFDLVWDEALLTLRGHLQQSLANARKYDSIRRQVVTDHLTGLYNRRYFVNRASEEIERSLSERAPVSIVMIDIDHFKRFNDTYGHSTGDRVLQAVGAILQESVRVTDTCARHGGEEFTLLLPNTPGENAVHLANRVRQTLGETRYTGLGLPKDAAITISCGVATCPQDATAVESLLELADRALYLAKERGRDRVCQIDASLDAPGGAGNQPPGVIQPVEEERRRKVAGRAASRRRLRVP
jgi:diguanylate cyclase (GGDEF)-like protein